MQGYLLEVWYSLIGIYQQHSVRRGFERHFICSALSSLPSMSHFNRLKNSRPKKLEEEKKTHPCQRFPKKTKPAFFCLLREPPTQTSMLCCSVSSWSSTISQQLLSWWGVLMEVPEWRVGGMMLLVFWSGEPTLLIIALISPHPPASLLLVCLCTPQDKTEISLAEVEYFSLLLIGQDDQVCLP